MPIFHFVLKNGWGKYRDVGGDEFQDAATARIHAKLVARELLRNRETRTGSWRIEVRNEKNDCIDEVMLASVDDHFSHLPQPTRAEIDRLYQTNASLADIIGDVRRSLHQVKATIARADRMPYLAAKNGERL